MLQNGKDYYLKKVIVLLNPTWIARLQQPGQILEQHLSEREIKL